MVNRSPSGAAVLFSEMRPPPGLEHDFNAWYDEEHIPLRMNCPGFLAAQRYRVEDSDDYLAVYELDGPGALSTPQYRALKECPSQRTERMLSSVSGFTRYLACEVSSRMQDRAESAQVPDAPVLYAVWFEVPEDAAEDFDAWYEREHVPLLLTCPEWLMVRRFRVLEGTPHSYTHLALHYLGDEGALESPARKAARSTAWRERLGATEWFNPSYSVFRRHGRRQVAEHLSGADDGPPNQAQHGSETDR